MPPRLLHLLHPLRRIHSCAPLVSRYARLACRVRQFTSATDITTSPTTATDDADLKKVPGRKDLYLHIRRPASATSNTPTIISLPLFTPAPSAPSSAIIITPTYAGEPPTFPAVLHDLLAAIAETRLLYPESRTGLLASRFLGGIAIAAALTQGSDVVTAVAADEPVVDLSTEGTAEGVVGWDTCTSTWQTGSGYDPELRRKIYGGDPRMYWTDPFAGPLLFFATPGVEFPPEEFGDGEVVGVSREQRRGRQWPPNGFVPGHGEHVLGEKEVVPKILLSLGCGRAAEDRALFVQRANATGRGGPVGVMKQEMKKEAMGQWLEAVLQGGDMRDVVETDPAERVLQTRFGGDLPELEEQESEPAGVGLGGHTGDLEEMSVEELLALLAMEKLANGMTSVKQPATATLGKAAASSSHSTEMLSVKEMLAMDRALWYKGTYSGAKAASESKTKPAAKATTTSTPTPATKVAASKSPSATQPGPATRLTPAAEPAPKATPPPKPVERSPPPPPPPTSAAPKTTPNPPTKAASTPTPPSTAPTTPKRPPPPPAKPSPWATLDQNKPKPKPAAAARKEVTKATL